jgi:hypothetical protein
MNLTRKLVVVLAAAAVTCAVHADTSDTVGTLGQRYGSFSFTDQSVKHSSNDLYDVDFGLNDPITRYLDLSGDLAYANSKHASLQRHSYILDTGATGYWAVKGLKPFATVNLGYEWDNLNAPLGYLDRPNYGTWATTVGVEIPTYPASVSPYITHQDDFRHSAHSNPANDYGVQVNYWFKTHSDWAVFADSGYQDVMHSIYDGWYFTIGLREKF